MWSAAQHITTGIGLVAFISALGLAAYRATMKNRLNTLKAVPATRRASIIAQQLNTYGVKAESLTQDQQYQLAERQLSLRARNSLYMAIFAIVVVLICGAIALMSSRGEPQEQLGGNPLLHVRPSVRDAHLRWNAGESSPRSEQEGDPFAITVTNSGDRNAINLILRFVLNLDTDKLIKMAQTSGLFSGKHIEGDAKRLKIPTRYSLSETSWALINFTEDNVVRRDEIQTPGEIIVSYPPVIRNAIALWILITSQSQAATWSDTRNKNFPNDPNLTMKYLDNQIQEQQRAHIVVVPDVTITIRYQDVHQNTLSTTNTIRSIYEYHWDSWAKRERDDRQRKLFMGDLVNAWLVLHGISHAPGDYSTGQPEGGEDLILTWNEAKLGPKPTKEELEFFMPGFIRDQQKVLSGGQGVFCYEDQNNPSEGRYNLYKNQGLFTPQSSSSATPPISIK